MVRANKNMISLMSPKFIYWLYVQLLYYINTLFAITRFVWQDTAQISTSHKQDFG